MVVVLPGKGYGVMVLRIQVWLDEEQEHLSKGQSSQQCAYSVTE
jgi:hypothetical protein